MPRMSRTKRARKGFRQRGLALSHLDQREHLDKYGHVTTPLEGVTLVRGACEGCYAYLTQNLGRRIEQTLIDLCDTSNFTTRDEEKEGVQTKE